MQIALEPLCDALRERRAATNAHRRMLPEMRDMVRSSQVSRITQPKAWGGFGGSLRDIVEALDAIGGACGSSGWVVGQFLMHNYMLAQFSPAGQEAVWGDDPDALLSGILIPTVGRYEASDGGYRLTGRWPWVTGVDSCDWCIFAAYEADKPGPATFRHFVLPRAELTVIDVWHAMGLKGSGTNDVVLEDHFVPEHLTLPLVDMKGGESAGGHWRDEPTYVLPGYALFGLGIASPTIGIAREIVNHYNAVVKKKTSVMSGQNIADFSSQHTHFAEAKCAADGAFDLLCLTAERFQAIACDERRAPTPEERARCRGTATYAAQTAVAAAQTVWTLAGASSVLDTNPLSGVYADLMVACQHYTINKDVNFKTYGRALFGLEIDNPLY